MLDQLFLNFDTVCSSPMSVNPYELPMNLLHMFSSTKHAHPQLRGNFKPLSLSKLTTFKSMKLPILLFAWAFCEFRFYRNPQTHKTIYGAHILRWHSNGPSNVSPIYNTSHVLRPPSHRTHTRSGNSYLHRTNEPRNHIITLTKPKQRCIEVYKSVCHPRHSR